MSCVGDPHALLSAKFSQVAPMLIGQDSLFTPTFWNTTNIHVIDETCVLTPVRDGTNFGGTVRFLQNKRATLTTEYLLEVTISGGTAAGGEVPVYVNNLGDQLLLNVVHRYGNHVLHE